MKTTLLILGSANLACHNPLVALTCFGAFTVLIVASIINDCRAIDRTARKMERLARRCR
jgi:hypothetical protein